MPPQLQDNDSVTSATSAKCRGRDVNSSVYCEDAHRQQGLLHVHLRGRLPGLLSGSRPSGPAGTRWAYAALLQQVAELVCGARTWPRCLHLLDSALHQLAGVAVQECNLAHRTLQHLGSSPRHMTRDMHDAGPHHRVYLLCSHMTTLVLHTCRAAAGSPCAHRLRMRACALCKTSLAWFRLSAWCWAWARLSAGSPCIEESTMARPLKAREVSDGALCCCTAPISTYVLQNIGLV